MSGTPSGRPRPPSEGPGPASSPPAPARLRLSGRRIALCVTGSIAAYKAAVVLRLLLKEGAEVEPVMTRSAERFIGGATLAGLSGKQALSDMWNSVPSGELHVDLAARSDLILVVPATADLIARLAGGRADDLVTATTLCAACPVVVVPAMHPSMWNHPATQRNVATLEADGRVAFVGPASGEVASGDFGIGRMVEPEDIVSAVVARLCVQDLGGRALVVTAGPTVEDLDPVRYVSNRSSGKMGFSIAERAAARGAHVTLIAGPVNLSTPYGVARVDVRSAVAMRGAVWQALGPDLSHADALIMAAAVGDYRPAEAHAAKLKRDANRVTLELVQNPDILSEVGHARRGRHPVLIGFAVETDTDDRVIHAARTKLENKRVDLVVANHANDSFGRDDNRATLVGATEVEPLPRLSKPELADHILDWVAQRFDETS
jgi:phosphopantothenoylcysteine decarboxylase / phosphopantothenate---cysteine ligase